MFRGQWFNWSSSSHSCLIKKGFKNIQTLQPDDNNAVYRCEAKNRMVAAPLTAEIVMSVQVMVTSMIYMKIYHWEVKHCKTIMSMMMMMIIAQISKHISFTVCTWQCYDPWACECKSGRNGLRSPSSPSPSPYSSSAFYTFIWKPSWQRSILSRWHLSASPPIQIPRQVFSG